MKRPIFKHVDSQIENYLPKNKKSFQKKIKQEKKTRQGIKGDTNAE